MARIVQVYEIEETGQYYTVEAGKWMQVIEDESTSVEVVDTVPLAERPSPNEVHLLERI